MKTKLDFFQKLKKGWIPLLFTLLFSTQIHAQINVTGKVTDILGQPLPGATIIVKGTNNGTTADYDGNFNLSDVAENAVLVVSYVSFSKKEVPVSTTALTIALEEGTALQEVLITAQKRGENIQKTPLAVSVLGGTKLAEQGFNTAENALRQVPGVEIQQVAQGAQIFLRGIGSGIDPSLADPSVALMVDGIYNGRTETLQAGVFDLNRIEVLRGPQGTLYGRNATGGTINVITNNPELSRNYGRAQVIAGNYDLIKTEVMYNAAFSDKFGLRVAGFFEKRNGYIDDGSDNLNHGAGRIKLMYKPSEKMSILARAEVYRRSDLGPNVVPANGSAGNLFFPPPFFTTNFDPTITNGPPFTGGVPTPKFPNGWEQTDPSDPWSNNPEHVPGALERESESFSLEINADLGNAGTLTVLPGITRTYNRLVSNYLFGSVSPVPGVVATYNSDGYADEESNVRYSTFEARLAAPESSKFKYLVGAFYLDARPVKGFEEVGNIASALSGQPVNFANVRQPSKTLAAFAQGTYPFSEKFRGTVGLRFSTDENGQGYTIDIDGQEVASDEFTQNVDNFQYKVGIEADLAENSLLYAHVATGFKQGGISNTIPARPFEPETLTSYEAGVKNTFAQGRIKLNVSAFFYDFNDYQIWFFEPGPIGDVVDQNGNPIINNFQVIGNAGNSKIKGAEIDLVAAPWKGGILNVSATFLDAKYGELTLPPNPFTGTDFFPLEGQQVQNSPDYSFNLGFVQNFNVGEGRLTLGVNSKISDSYFASNELFMPGGFQDAYTRTNLNASYSINKFNLGFFLNNLENEAQVLFPFPAYRRLISSPRHLGFSASINF